MIGYTLYSKLRDYSYLCRIYGFCPVCRNGQTLFQMKSTPPPCINTHYFVHVPVIRLNILIVTTVLTNRESNTF